VAADPVSAWTAATAYAAGVFVTASTPGALRFRSSGGTTGGAEPSWPGVAGGTVNDNDITWTAVTRSRLEMLLEKITAILNAAALSTYDGESLPAAWHTIPFFGEVDTPVIAVYPDTGRPAPKSSTTLERRWSVVAQICERVDHPSRAVHHMLLRELMEDALVESLTFSLASGQTVQIDSGGFTEEEQVATADGRFVYTPLRIDVFARQTRA